MSSIKLEEGLNIFSAEFCVPCKMSKSLLDKESVQYNSLDMEQHSELFAENNVRSVPTFVFVENGEVLPEVTKVGGISPVDIKDWKELGLI